MPQPHSSASCDNKGVSSGGFKAGTSTSTKRARSTPSAINPPGLPLRSTTTPKGASSQPSTFLPTPAGTTFGSS